MKRTMICAICIALMITVFASCGSVTDPAGNEDGKLKIVTTIFPEYDWTRNITADLANVTMLLDTGVDLHSFQPTAADIVTVSSCDVFIYVGGESDSWVSTTLAEATNKDMIVINLMEALGDAVKEEELKEGMEAEDGEEEETEYDEHVWLSLKNAAALCRVIGDKLGEADPTNSEAYKTNAAKYIEKLNELDTKYKETADSAPVKTLLFGDRFPFRYLTDDYGLDYFAAFMGCSAESEASFETITFLAGKVDELDLHSIMKIETSDGSIARTVRDTSKAKDQQILTMNSLQSITADDVAAGADYLRIMEDNLEVLKDALK